MRPLSVSPNMRVLPYTSEFFGFDGRGPEIHRLIHDRDLLKGGSFPDRQKPPGNIIGVEYFWFEHPEMAWVLKKRQSHKLCLRRFVFIGLLSSLRSGSRVLAFILLMTRSGFLRLPSQRNISRCRHFILMFTTTSSKWFARVWSLVAADSALTTIPN
jgi:hypothetical protein